MRERWPQRARALLILFLLALGTIIPDALAQPDGAQVVTTVVRGTLPGQVIANAPNGAAAMIWKEVSDSPGPGVALKASVAPTGARWLAPVTLWVGRQLDAYFDVASDGNGGFWFVWDAADEAHISRNISAQRASTDGRWQEPMRLATGVATARGVEVAFNGSNAGAVVWMVAGDWSDNDPTGALWASTFSRTTGWSDPANLGNSTGESTEEFSLTATESEGLWLFWVKDDEMQARRYNGPDGWSPQQALGPVPALRVDRVVSPRNAEAVPAVAAATRGTNFTLNLTLFRRGAGAWLAPDAVRSVANADCNSEFCYRIWPELIARDAANASLVWQEPDDAGANAIWWLDTSGTGTLRHPARVDDPPHVWTFAVAAAPGGRLAVVWAEWTPPAGFFVNVRMRMIDAEGRPGASRPIAGSPRLDTRPVSLVFAQDGSAVFGWSEYSADGNSASLKAQFFSATEMAGAQFTLSPIELSPTSAVATSALVTAGGGMTVAALFVWWKRRARRGAGP